MRQLGYTEEAEKEIVQSLIEFEREPHPNIELNEFTFDYAEAIKIEEDEILLHKKSTLTKLAVSHGIAQSVKLSTFEELIQKTIEHTKTLPLDLARSGFCGMI